MSENNNTPENPEEYTPENLEEDINIKSHSKSNIIFWRTFWVVIIFIATLFIYAEIKGNKIEAASNNKIVFSEELLNSFQNVLPKLPKEINNNLRRDASKDIRNIIDSEIDDAYESVYAQIPKLADFHYSIIGEYSELTAALTGDISKYTKKILFEEIGFEESVGNHLFAVQEKSNQVVSRALNKTNQTINNDLNANNDEINALNNFFERSTKNTLNRFNNLTINTIRGIGTAGGTASAALLSKLIAKKLAVKLVVKSGTKAFAGFVIGGTVGFFTAGPLGAVALGAVGAIGGWLVTDAVILTVDEHFTRDDFEKQIRVLVDHQRDSFKSVLNEKNIQNMDIISDEYSDTIKRILVQDIVHR